MVGRLLPRPGDNFQRPGAGNGCGKLSGGGRKVYCSSILLGTAGAISGDFRCRRLRVGFIVFRPVFIPASLWLAPFRDRPISTPMALCPGNSSLLAQKLNPALRYSHHFSATSFGIRYFKQATSFFFHIFFNHIRLNEYYLQEVIPLAKISCPYPKRAKK